MPVVICDSECQLSKHLPDTLSELRVADLHVNVNTDNRYIQGHIKWTGQLQRTKYHSLIKVIIEQDSIELPIFFVGKFAEAVQMITTGDRLLCSAVVIESNSRPTDIQSSCQVVVDPSLSKAMIWVVHKQLKTPVKVTNHSDQTVIASSSLSSAVKTSKEPSVAVRTYQYTCLDKIKVRQTVNVFGVVKYLKTPTKTRGSDYSLFVSIMDDTCPVKLKCMIFARSEQMLPPIQKPGEIVRFHRLKITEFNEELQGQGNCCHGFSCLVFSGEVGSPLTPKSVSNTYTCTDSDLNRVSELREWLMDNEALSQQVTSASDEASSSRRTLFKDCMIGQFFDLTCQVVGTCLLNDKSCLLKVWDGTCPTFVSKQEDLTKADCSCLCIDKALNSEAGHYVVDVYVFDEHVEKACRVKPLDYVLLKNLHAATYPKSNATTSCKTSPVEFIIHGGGSSFGRDIIILNDSEREVIDLKQQLLAATSLNNVKPSGPSDNAMTSGQDVNCQNLELRHGGICDPPLDGVISFGAESRCMLNTATVLISNQGQQTSTIKEVVQKVPPHKFRLLCHVKDISPMPDKPEDLIKLYCRKCHYMSSLPVACNNGPSTEATAPVFYKMDKELRIFTCPRCTGLDENKCLEYVMMLQLLLYDDTGWIVAGIWREEAVKFFHNITAAAILLQDEIFQYVKMHLAGLIQANSSSSVSHHKLRDVVDKTPLIECCVKSYIAMGGVCYQIFDTCLTRSNDEN